MVRLALSALKSLQLLKMGCQPEPGFLALSVRLTSLFFIFIFNHMVKYKPHPLDHTFAALSDSTRRAILARLAQGEAAVSELAEPFDISLPAISKHLRVLEGAGLIQRTKQGRVHRLRLLPEPLCDAATWIAFYQSFWEKRE